MSDNDLLSDITGGILPDEFEVILNSVNSSLGSAININTPGISDAEKISSVIFNQNYAIAFCIFYLWLNTEKNKSLFDPNRMLEDQADRWLKILKIPVQKSDTLQNKKNKIIELFLRWTTPPNLANIKSKLIELVPEIFVELDLDNPNFIGVRTWLPTDHSGNNLLSEGEFFNKLNSYNLLLSDYLPTYTIFNTYRFATPGTGTVTVAEGSTTVTGTGTSFTSIFSAGSKFESVDDNNILKTYIVDSVTSDTELEITVAADSNNTNGIFRLTGFILDAANNLNNMVLA